MQSIKRYIRKKRNKNRLKKAIKRDRSETRHHDDSDRVISEKEVKRAIIQNK